MKVETKYIFNFIELHWLQHIFNIYFGKKKSIYLWGVGIVIVVVVY